MILCASLGVLSQSSRKYAKFRDIFNCFEPWVVFSGIFGVMCGKFGGGSDRVAQCPLRPDLTQSPSEHFSF